MPTRTTIRGRGEVHYPGHELHGAKVDLLQRLVRSGEVLLRIREPHGRHIVGALAKLPADRFRQEPHA